MTMIELKKKKKKTLHYKEESCFNWKMIFSISSISWLIKIFFQDLTVYNLSLHIKFLIT